MGASVLRIKFTKLERSKNMEVAQLTGYTEYIALFPEMLTEDE